MTLDRKLALEACHQLWQDYHAKIEEYGHRLGKDSLMLSPEGISLVATIRPPYSQEMLEVFRNIIPREYEYNGEFFPVMFFPSVYDL